MNVSAKGCECYRDHPFLNDCICSVHLVDESGFLEIELPDGTIDYIPIVHHVAQGGTRIISQSTNFGRETTPFFQIKQDDEEIIELGPAEIKVEQNKRASIWDKAIARHDMDKYYKDLDSGGFC